MAEPSWLVGLVQADSTLAGLPLAFLLGATVGAEREWRQSPASLRACTLICVAAAGFADLAITRVDPGNLGAAFGAIAQGVGFLGAGAILREGLSVKGLSTAATIWCVAAIGAQAGAQESVGAIWLTVLVLAVNLILKPLQQLIHKWRPTPPSGDDEMLEG
jgi:putative Mg2+ transporter-C (MgtC) family protein